MIKYLLYPLCMTISLFGQYSSNPEPVTGSTGQSKMHQMQQKHPDTLPDDQRHVMNMLSPMYKRIYMYALDDDQREAVAVFERRGENPYKSIDSILKRDRMRTDPAMNHDRSPRGRTKRASDQKSYVISQRDRNQYVDDVHDNDDDDDDYEMYTSSHIQHEDQKSSKVQTESRPKHPEGPCYSCGGKEPRASVRKKPVVTEKKPSSCQTCETNEPRATVRKQPVKVEKKKSPWYSFGSKKSKSSPKKKPVKVQKKKSSKSKDCNSGCCETRKQIKHEYKENYSRCKCNSCSK